MAIEQVRATLQRFQDGYTLRDVSRIDEFMTLFADDAEVIGTNGIRPGVSEWYMDKPGHVDWCRVIGKGGAICGWMWRARTFKHAGMSPG